MSQLNSVLSQYPNITSAPSLADLQALAIQKRLSIEAIKKDERLVKYKTIDRYGDVYVIQNPAAWEYDLERKAFIWPLPIKIGNINQMSPAAPKAGIIW
jgi:hypothetical protein